MKPKKILTAITAILFTVAAFNISAQSLETAKYYTSCERFEDANAIFEALIKAQPNNGDVFFYAGENVLYEYFTDTVYGSAVASAIDAGKFYSKGILADSNNPLCYVGMVKVSMLLKKTDDASKFLNKAISKFPSKTNKTSTIVPAKQALTRAKIAEAYILIDRKKNITKALAELEKAIELDPGNPEIYLIYGDAFLEGNDGSKAITQYKKSQELNPKSPSAKLRLGNLWIRAKQWNTAIDYYKEAIDIDSNFAPAYLELGKLYSKANQLDKSLFYYKKYDDMSTNISAKIKYVNVLVESKKYEDAINKLNEISKTDSSRNDLNRAFAYCYFETNKIDMALKYVNKFFVNAELEKIKSSDYLYKGKILSKSGKDSLAIIEFKKAYELDSSNIDILSDIANSFNRLKNYREAAQFYERKVSIPGEKSKIPDYYKLGLVYYNLGQIEKNIEIWKDADRTFKKITDEKPDFMGGKAFFYRAVINSMVDTLNNTIEAKPLFETYIKYGIVDSVKNKTELINCYDYLAYFNFKNKDFCMAIFYWQKIVGIDPTNKKALDLLKETKGKCPENK